MVNNFKRLSKLKNKFFVSHILRQMYIKEIKVNISWATKFKRPIILIEVNSAIKILTFPPNFPIIPTPYKQNFGNYSQKRESVQT